MTCKRRMFVSLADARDSPLGGIGSLAIGNVCSETFSCAIENRDSCVESSGSFGSIVIIVVTIIGGQYS